MKIIAFQGFHYRDPATAAACAAPPFDQIDEAARQRFHASSPHHYAHLTRPAAPPEEFGAVRALHDAWTAAGVVVRDVEPALYLYEIEVGEHAAAGVRLGLTTLVGVGPSSEGELRPHEHTVAKPLAERLALLEATRIDLEPVMLLAEDDGSLERMLAQDRESAVVLVEHHDATRGETHRLRTIDDPTRIAAYQDLLAPRGAVIADGHHRTKVAQRFAAKHRPEVGSAACGKLAVLFSLASESLVIDPIHRGLTREIERATVEGCAAARRPFAGSSGAELAIAVAAAAQPAIGVRWRGADPELWTLDPRAVPEDTPGAEAGLSAVLLQYQLLAAAGLQVENASDGTLVYRADPDTLWREVEAGELEAGFWLPPMTPEAFALATAEGDVLPPKSTRFLPKLISGLVWCGHDARTAH
ncbi:MAG TPA: DUF1015 domain-containing protein [Thermoanaerobaculia bacterium]|nr:DUF1015 domain-containing protein [Thermoanaerobaculia bacterium]